MKQILSSYSAICVIFASVFVLLWIHQIILFGCVAIPIDNSFRSDYHNEYWSSSLFNTVEAPNTINVKEFKDFKLKKNTLEIQLPQMSIISLEIF